MYQAVSLPFEKGSSSIDTAVRIRNTGFLNEV